MKDFGYSTSYIHANSQQIALHFPLLPYLVFTLIHTYICYSYTSLCSLYVEEQLGRKYVEKRTIPFDESYKETGPATPVFFVLSPGVDPLKDVEAVGKKLGFTLDQGNFHNVSLGQVRAC